MGKKSRLKTKRSNRTIPKREQAPKAPSIPLNTRDDLLKWLFLALIVFLIYSNTLGSPFVFDDARLVPDNPNIRLTNLTLKEISRAAFDGPSSTRPFPKISFALNYYFHQYDVLGYHLVNIFIHIANGILLYLFAQMTLGLLSQSSGLKFNNWIPFFTALVWMIHPIQTQSVTYIVQRMNSMAAMFYVLSLFFYGRARLSKDKREKRFLFAGCIISGLFSLGSKEMAATLPFFIFLYEWYFFQGLSRTWVKRHLLPLGGLLLILVFVSFLYLGSNPLEKLVADYKTYPFNLAERVMTEFRVVVYYLSLLILPHPSRLNIDYDFSISHSLWNPSSTLFSLLLIAGLIGLALYKVRSRVLLSFAILWFFGNIAIESSVIGLDIIFEHRTYLPSMLVSLLAVVLIFQYIKPKWLGVGILCLIVVMFSIWTYERNKVWHDDLTLWADCAKKSPNKARPHTNLGVALLQRGKTKEAKEQYEEALRLNPNYIDAHNNLGIILRRQGQLERAMIHFSEVLRIDPDYREAHNNLGNTFYGLGQLDKAIGHYKEALRIDPHDAIAHYNLGNLFGNQGNLKQARKHYEEALRINPHFPEARRNLQKTTQLMTKTTNGTKALVRR